MEIEWHRPDHRFGSNSSTPEHDEISHQSDAARSGEMPASKHTASKLNSMRDKYKFQNAVRTGKVKTIPHYRTKNIDNTDSEPRSFTSLEKAKRDRVSSQMSRRGGKVDMPITMKGERGRSHLVAGNTRLTYNSQIKKRPTKVLEID